MARLTYGVQSNTGPIRASVRGVANPYAWLPRGFLQDMLFKTLLIVAPIQSVLLTPVQGTTPAFLLIMSSLAVLASNDTRYIRLWMFVTGYILAYSVYLMLSLSSYYIDEPDISQLTVIRDVYVLGWLRQSHITQGAYLLVPLLFCYLVYSYYQESFIKYAFYGMLLLSAYGFYEFVFYAIFHTNGDFISNRNFGDLDSAAAGAGDGEAGFATGSLLQTSNLFGPSFMRLKSLVGEPSMYALTVVPFTVYAFARKWWALFAILLFSLVLGSSTTAILGLVVGIGYAYMRRSVAALIYIAAFLIIVALLYYTYDPVSQALDNLLFNKLDSGSGSDRLRQFLLHAGAAFDGNFVRTLFGLGFGTVRSTDMLSNLLANVGVVGVLIYSAMLLAPCFLLKKGGDADAIIGALLAAFVMEMLTVSEFSYLPPWFMVALGFARVRQQRLALPAPRT
jgi:hypothetical protein